MVEGGEENSCQDRYINVSKDGVKYYYEFIHWQTPVGFLASTCRDLLPISLQLIPLSMFVSIILNNVYDFL